VFVSGGVAEGLRRRGAGRRLPWASYRLGRDLFERESDPFERNKVSELSYYVHILSQFMQHPREEHWQVALRVVRYLKQHPGQGILLSRACDLHLHAWCDADWARCPLTRRSLTGWLIFLGESPIS